MDIKDYRYFNVENIPGEIWKDIEGFEDEYEISSEGRVRSKSRYSYSSGHCAGREILPKILTPAVTSRRSKGFPTYAVTLASGGRDKHHYCRSIIKLMGSAFNIPRDPSCTHLVTIDSLTDFSVDNLIYVSTEEWKELLNQ